YSTNSKAFRVFNSRTRIVEENLHVKFSENTPNIVGSRPNWLFDIDALTKSMNYKSVVAGNQSNISTGSKACEFVGVAPIKYGKCQTLGTTRGGVRNRNKEKRVNRINGCSKFLNSKG
ncbi:hypothetical protein Tco_0258760, partial [Tanacetum coccineum]